MESGGWRRRAGDKSHSTFQSGQEHVASCPGVSVRSPIKQTLFPAEEFSKISWLGDKGSVAWSTEVLHCFSGSLSFLGQNTLILPHMPVCFWHLFSSYLSFDCLSLTAASAPSTALSLALHFLLLLLLCLSLLAVSKLQLYGFFASLLSCCLWALMQDPTRVHKPLPHFYQQCTPCSGSSPFYWDAVLRPVGTSEALKRIAVRSKMLLIKGNLARNIFLADGSFLLVKCSWWTSLICWCGQEGNHIQRGIQRSFKSIHASCKALFLFQVYF